MSVTRHTPGVAKLSRLALAVGSAVLVVLYYIYRTAPEPLATAVLFPGAVVLLGVVMIVVGKALIWYGGRSHD